MQHTAASVVVMAIVLILMICLIEIHTFRVQRYKRIANLRPFGLQNLQKMFQNLQKLYQNEQNGAKNIMMLRVFSKICLSLHKT
jgi:LPS O-antigen subunit length determinant protein (WzzB/FepE family)